MALLTIKRLEQMLNRSVDSSHVLVAKNMIMDASPTKLAEMLGIPIEEITEILASEDYREVFTLVSADNNERQIDNILTIDEIEQRAWKNVARKIEFTDDIEVSARIAVMANRATRRVAVNEGVLDPGSVDSTVKIKLTKRVIETLQSQRLAQTRDQSILVDGAVKNPTFEQLQKFLGGNKSMEEIQPQIVHRETETSVSVESLMGALRGTGV